jgi:hypothetical protein
MIVFERKKTPLSSRDECVQLVVPPYFNSLHESSGILYRE